MKELNEIELRKVDGGMTLSLFLSLGPGLGMACLIAEFCAGFADGYNENKR